MFLKIGVLRNFTTFKEKHLCWSCFLSKETPAQVFPVNIAKFLRTDFSYRTLMVAASELESKLD